jgi:hypothetical protein
MTHSTFIQSERSTLALVTLLCFIIVYFTWYPGVYTMDELDIFTQSLHGSVHDGHSPLLVSLWSLTNAIKLGPALPYMLALAAVIIGCARMCERIASRPVIAAMMLPAMIALPPVFTSLGLVTKDIFLVASMLAVFHSLMAWVAAPGRRKLLLAAFFIQLAVFIRLDAVFALFPVLIYMAWFELVRHRADGLLTRLLSIVAASLLVIVLGAMARLSNQYLFKATPYHAEQVSMLFDLSAITVQTNHMLIPPSRLAGHFDLPEIRARFNPSIADALIWSTDSRHLVYQPSADHRELHKAWWDAIRTNPMAYIRFRTEYAARFIGLRNNVAHMRAQFFADGSMASHPENGWRKTGSPLQNMYLTFSETALGKYVFMPWVWLLAGLLPLFGFASGYLGRKYDAPGRLLPQLLVISAISYTVLMSCISAASLARYHSWPRVAIGIALVAAFFEMLTVQQMRRRRRSPTEADHERGTAGERQDPVRG